MAISRKKAIDLMSTTYRNNYPRYQLMFLAEDVTPDALYPFREDVIKQLQQGRDPHEVMDSTVESAIRTVLLERRMSNAYNPRISDVLTDELRAQLNAI